MNKEVTLKPRMSEKAYGLSQARNTYVFDVPGNANKHVVARAVEAQFKVSVTEVNIANVKGKSKRTVFKRGRAKQGSQSDVKKAYVTLKKGDSLPIFAAVEEAAEKQEKVAELAEKAAEKRAKKEKK
jgi:large subunit ribosomal protein L23